MLTLRACLEQKKASEPVRREFLVEAASFAEGRLQIYVEAGQDWQVVWIQTG